MRILLIPLVVVACNGNGDGVAPPVETGTSTPGAHVTVRDDEASVLVLSQQPSQPDPTPSTLFLGVFAESRRNVLNLAQCLASDPSFCVEELPRNAGDSVVATPFDPSIRDQMLTRDVGHKITLGDWTAKYTSDPTTGLGYYFATEPDVDLPNGPLGLHIPGGDWAEYTGTDDLKAPIPMHVTSPDPKDVTDFFSNAPIHLEWRPGNQGDSGGDVFLLSITPAEERLYKLDDTGSYDLDLSKLHLKDGDSIELLLGRWSVTELNLDGNSVDMEIQSNQVLVGTWRTIGSRDPFTDLYDECVDAESAPSASPGNYYGDLRGSHADLNPKGSGCTGSAAPGIDEVIPIDLQDQDRVTINYQLVADDASLYLLTDCTKVDADTCLAGSDQKPNKGVEQAVYVNNTGGPQRVYAILDAFKKVTDLYNLDIIIDSLGGDVLVPTCVDALTQGPAATGSYHGSIAGFSDLLEPDCAGGPTGAEGMTQILLQPGQELSASVTAPGGDPKLYLLSNCSIADSCFLEDDQKKGESEDIVYTNASYSSEYLYLVVDSDANLGDYVLDITIQ